MKRVMGNLRAFAAVGRELSRVVPPSCTAVAAGGYGGLPLAAAVAHKLRLPLTAIRAGKRKHGTAQALEGRAAVNRL